MNEWWKLSLEGLENFTMEEVCHQAYEEASQGNDNRINDQLQVSIQGKYMCLMWIII